MSIPKLFSISLLLVGFSCTSVKLASLPDKPTNQLDGRYRIFKNLSYGSDTEQKMDIYLAKNQQELGKKNFTIVFLHGGGYYFSDKSREEKYIYPYFEKGLNVVNVNYRLKRGIPSATQDLTNVLNFLKANNGTYQLNLRKVVLT